MKVKEETLYIKRILDGETELFALFLDRYSRPIHSLVVQIVSSTEDAEEIVQDTFLKAFNSLGSFRGEAGFSTWLYRIAYNMALSATRKRKQEFVWFEEETINRVADEDAESVLFPTDNEEKINRLVHAVELLAPDEKALITLYYYEEKPVDEVAEITKLTPSNVKVKLHRIRKKLYVLLNTSGHGRI